MSAGQKTSNQMSEPFLPGFPTTCPTDPPVSLVGNQGKMENLESSSLHQYWAALLPEDVSRPG